MTLHPSSLPALYVGALGTAGWLSAFAEGRLAWEYDGDTPVQLIGDAGAGVQLAVGGWSRVSAGRPLRAKGRIVLPGAAAHVDASPAFVHAARAEWASVPTFLRLASELRLLGAPSVLVGRSFTAARDEIQHTVDCLTTAGAPVVLGPLSAAPPRLQPRRDWLLRLAAESEIDGVLGEGAAADTLAREVSMCRDESTARRLDRMATEERDHSNLAKDVVAWAQHELR